MNNTEQASATEARSRHIAEMFDRIAPTYDLLNRMLSLGFDERWRKTAMQAGKPAAGERWLDVAAGSGDVIFAGLRYASDSHWFALDPSKQLLRRLKQKTPEDTVIPRTLARAEALPYADESFDGVTVAFGVRNFADTKGGLSEIFRVLKPGGRLIVLEFHPSEGRRWGRHPLVRFYLEHLLPVFGKLVSGDSGAYRYLAESSRGFWTVQRMMRELRQIGFSRVQWMPLFLHSVMLTRAVK